MRSDVFVSDGQSVDTSDEAVGKSTRFGKTARRESHNATDDCEDVLDAMRKLAGDQFALFFGNLQIVHVGASAVPANDVSVNVFTA